VYFINSYYGFAWEIDIHPFIHIETLNSLLLFLFFQTFIFNTPLNKQTNQTLQEFRSCSILILLYQSVYGQYEPGLQFMPDYTCICYITSKLFSGLTDATPCPSNGMKFNVTTTPFNLSSLNFPNAYPRYE
jgi:hypothetical protein